MGDWLITLFEDKMRLKLQRYSCHGDSTLGLLYLGKELISYTLEDIHRDVKIAGKTRIPAGTYKLKLRNDGGLNQKYHDRYPDIHRGMIWLQDVPDFEWIYIHVGNHADHTEGCILIGDQPTTNTIGRGIINASGDTYRRIYPLIADKIKTGLSITIRDEQHIIGA